MSIKAIPTVYKGTHFRSRLEARWAAMFDLLNWKWEYEPIDLDGYIPDFILRFKQPLLIEVKPVIDVTDARAFADARLKLSNSGWNEEAVIVGSCFADSTELDGHTVIGQFADGHGAAMLACRCGYGVFDDLISYHCRSCGEQEHGGYPTAPSRDALDVLWREAGNRVQWRGRDSKRQHTGRKRKPIVYPLVSWEPGENTSIKPTNDDPRRQPVPKDEVRNFFRNFDFDRED